MARKKQGGNFGTLVPDSFSRIPKVEEYTAQLKFVQHLEVVFKYYLYK